MLDWRSKENTVRPEVVWNIYWICKGHERDSKEVKLKRKNIEWNQNSNLNHISWNMKTIIQTLKNF